VLKTLVVTPDFPPALGGIQTLIHRLVRHSRKLDIRVVTLDSPGARQFDRGQPLYVRRAPYLRRWRPVSIGILNAMALREAFAFGPDVVLSAHIVTSPAAAAISRCLSIPVVQYLYGKEIGAKPRLTRFALDNAAAGIAISRYTRDLAVATGAHPHRLALIPPGVDPVDPASEPSAGPWTPRPTFVSIARLEDRYKGHDVVMRAMPLILARVPEAKWVIVGDGPLRAHLERLSAVHGVTSHVRFVGAVSDEERDTWLGRSALLAMPSRLPARGAAGEGFGIVYLEAGVRGVPVIAGNVAGAVDAVIDGQTGVLVDPDDHVAVGDAIASLLEDPARARRLGQGGRAHAEALAWPRIAARVEDVLHGVA
jgi:phosphatidylinositol alpha-1,6-mannosyltransferase